MSRPLIAAVHLLLALPAVAWAADDPVSIEVLDEGRVEGRRQLRLSFTEGGRSRQTMTMKMAMAMRLDGAALPAASIPAVEFVQTSEIVDVDEAGVARVVVRLEQGRVLAGPDDPPPAVQAMERALQGIEGIRGTFRMSDRGILLDGTFEFAAGNEPLPEVRQMIDSMQQSIQQMVAPFPREPIGVGGRWRTVMQPTLNGITMRLTATYTVTELSPEGVTLDVGIEQSAAPQDVAAPNLPAGAMRLEAVAGAGSGTARYAFDVPFPVAVSTAVKTDMQMTMRAGEKVAQMETTVQADLELVGETVGAAVPAGGGR